MGSIQHFGRVVVVCGDSDGDVGVGAWVWVCGGGCLGTWGCVGTTHTRCEDVSRETFGENGGRKV